MSIYTDANYLKGVKQDENHKKQSDRRNKKADETTERLAKIMEIRKERGLLNSFEILDLTATCICGDTYDTLGNHLKTCKIANTIVCELCNKSYIGEHNCKKNTCVCGKICNDKHLLVCRVAKKNDRNTPILCECGETYLKKHIHKCKTQREYKTNDVVGCDCGKSYLYQNRKQHLSTKYHLSRVLSV